MQKFYRRKFYVASVREETRVWLSMKRLPRYSRAVLTPSCAHGFIQSVTPRLKRRWMAANRKAYHVVDEAELAKLPTEHHGGVWLLD